MVTTRSKTRKLETGSTSRVVKPSDLISRCSINIPQELITEIIVRLPVKSLVRFKSVSKPWLHLISDPQFTRYHLSKSSRNEADNFNFQIMYALNTRIKRCSLDSALHDPNFYRKKFAAKNEHPIVGIVNGLVCLNLKGTDLLIWNPALNRIRKIVSPESPSRCVDCLFSFGYEESEDDYKVVCLQTVIINSAVFYAEVSSVYSLKSDSWRRIHQFKGFYTPHPGLFANAKIYWYGTVPALGKTKFVSLDMSSDEFVELQHPQYDEDAHRLEMGVSGGRLFVLCNYYEGNFSISKPRGLVLWVLEKFENEEVWCKLVSIRYTDVNRTLTFDYRVLRILSNGEIVFGDPSGLLVYNWKKKEFRKIKVAVDSIDTHSRITAYVESLVWPDNA